MTAVELRFEDLIRDGSLAIGDGYRAKNEELGGEGPIFLRAAYLQDAGFVLDRPDRFLDVDIEKFGPKISQLGDVVITTKGNSTGRVGRIRPAQCGAIYSPHLSYWRSLCPNKIDRNFLYYWSRGSEFLAQLRGMAHGTDMAPYLSLRDQYQLRITLPQYRLQKLIGEILGALDDKIELNRRMNETLEAMARAIFKDWFVDFGPTRAKMAMRGEDPQKDNVARAPYLAPDIWSLFPDRLDDEGKPEGWLNSLFGAEFNLTMGQSPPGETYNETGQGLPFFQGRTDFGFRYPTRRKFCSAPTRIAQADDTLVSVRAPVGALNMAWEECCIGRGVAAVRHKSGCRSFTQYFLQSLQPEIARFDDSGSVFGAINKAQFEHLQVLAPSIALIDIFEAIVESVDDRIRANTSEAETLAATRDLLLPKLMSGEVRIKDAEKMVGEAL